MVKKSNGFIMIKEFPICDGCMKDLREIISERRKPKVVEIGGVVYQTAEANHKARP